MIKPNICLVRGYETGVGVDPFIVKCLVDWLLQNYEIEEITIGEADATELPFGKDEFDMVLSFDVLHHISRWDKAIAEMDRVLQPEGVCVFHDLAFSRLAARNLEGLFKNYGAFYTVGDFIQHLQRNNLEIVYAQTPKSVMIAEHFSMVAQKG